MLLIASVKPSGQGWRSVFLQLNLKEKLSKSMQKLLQVPTWAYVIMKVSVAQILLAGLFLSFAYAESSEAQSVLDKRISIELENTTIRSALSRIEKISDAKFLYHSQLVSSREKISLHEENTPLADILDKILSPYEIGYEVSGNQIVL